MSSTYKEEYAETTQKSIDRSRKQPQAWRARCSNTICILKMRDMIIFLPGSIFEQTKSTAWFPQETVA